MMLSRAFLLLSLVTSALAQVTTTGFNNAARAEAPGTLLSHPITNGSEPIGRTTSINYLNGWIIVGGESPGSRAGSDLLLRVYDISNPANPVRRLPSEFGLSYPNNSWYFNNFGWNAHGTAQTGTMLVPQVIGVSTFGGIVERGGQSGSAYPGDAAHGLGFNRSAQAGPWLASFPWYGSPDTTFTIQQSFAQTGANTGYRTLASFDHVGAFGGGDWHPMFFGDLLIYARSGGAGRDGVVVYRMQYNDFDNPATRSITPQYVASLSSGFTAYWPVFYSDGTALYVVGAGTNVVMAADITSATVPGGGDEVRLAANLTVPGLTNAPYPVFQDNFGFIHNRKIDMNRLVAGDANPVVLSLNENVPPVPAGQPAAPSGVDTSQMSLALGNLWLTGGYPGGTFGQANYQAQGMGVWVHQQAADTTPPRVSYHIPQSGRTNYPRHAPLSFLIFEHGSRGAPRNGIDFTVRPVLPGDTLGAAVAGYLIHDFSGVLTFTPTNGLAADTTYQVDFLSNPASQIGWRDAAGNYIEPYSFRFSTGGGLNASAPPVFTSFTASNYQPAPNQNISVNATATGTGTLEYRFNFDGTWSAWSGTATANHTYLSAGRPRVLAQVRDAAGNIVTNSLRLLVITAPVGPLPTQSSTLAIGDDAGTRRVWSVNPDANTVTVVHAITGAKEAEYAVGVNPRNIARDVNGRYWVTCHGSDEIRVLNADGTPHTTITLAYGSAPFGIAASPNGTLLYVTLDGAGSVQRYSAASPNAAPLTTTGLDTPRALAISADGSRVLVTRFLSPELHAEIREFTAALALTRTFTLSSANDTDGGDRASGVPNYLAGIAISPDGTRAAIVGKQDNILRGTLFGVGDLTHETTVRAVISFLNLTTNAEIPNSRRDFDNSESPSAVAYTPLGDTLLIAHQGNNRIVGMDALNLAPLASQITEGSTYTQPAVLTLDVGTGLAPQGILIDATSGRLFTQDFMGRSVTVLNAAPLLTQNQTSLPLIATTNAVTTELLTPTVLQGKRIFYNAADPRMSADSYISCASCHVDGGHDGRVWDFTGRGEGLRRTTDLRGRSGMGHGAVHWSGNFDEIQDFEHDMRGPFGGTGFLNLTPQQFAAQHPNPASGKTGLSSDLDALAAYVSSLTPAHTPRSPQRKANGTLTTAALAGQAVFTAQNCATCHSGTSFTNDMLMNVGTQSALSGSRLGLPLPGIDTPTLQGLHATRVYLHHGQAPTLGDVFSYNGGRLLTAVDATLVGLPSGARIMDSPQEGGGGFERGMLGGGYVAINGTAGNGVRFTQVDGGASGGAARLSVRHMLRGGGSGVIVINGASQPFTLLPQSPPNGWQTSGWRWTTVNVVLQPGATNTIEVLRSAEPFANFHFNAVLIGNAEVLAQTEPHSRVQNLSTTDRNNLLTYLRQLDGRDANGVPHPAPLPPSPQPPSLLSGPASVTLAEGGSLHFVVAVSGTGPFSYEWRRGTTVVGTNSAELQIMPVSLADAGNYTCTITNAQGSISTQPAMVTVNGALTITTTTLAVGTVGVPYQATLTAAGGVSTRTWSLLNGVLPSGIILSTSGVLSGIPTAPARAALTLRVSDASGSDTQALALDLTPVGGFVNDPDLILHYTFDEGSGSSVWDIATGGNNHATNVTNAHWITDGRFGGAYGPSSTNAGMQNFTPANQSDLNLNPRGDAFTISLWCRTTTTNGYTTLFSKDSASPQITQFRLWGTNPTSALQGINGGQYGGGINTAPALNDGQWHLVTMVNFNDAGTWRTRVYFDNGTQNTTFNTGNGGTVSDLLRIGGLSAGWNGWFGQIDDFRVYRRALTQTEIAALHAAPNPQTYGGWSAANLPPSFNGPEQDANGNGIPNLIEFIAPQPLSMQLTGGTATLNLTRNSAARGVTLIVECSTDLTTWTPLATSVNGATPTGTATISEGNGVVRTLTVQHSASPNGSFYRVRVVMP
jgi:cytochrome c peroxidase